jgi:hypothetical protein
MYELWYHTPIKVYVNKSGNYQDCKNYITDNMNLLKSWGYYFTIRLNGIAIEKIGSKMLPM